MDNFLLILHQKQIIRLLGLGLLLEMDMMDIIMVSLGIYMEPETVRRFLQLNRAIRNALLMANSQGISEGMYLLKIPYTIPH